MRVLRIDESSPYRQLVGIGGLGTGIFFELEDDHTLGRNESRPARLLDVRDYCKLHIVLHHVAKLLGAQASGRPFHVVPVGKVGDDAAGRRVIGEMESVGIDVNRVSVISSSPTLFSVCFQYPDGTGGNITTSNSAADTLCEGDIAGIAELLSTGGRRVIALAVPEVPLRVRRHFLEMASRTEAFCAASFVAAEIQPTREAGMFELLDLVALNEGEAEILVGQSFSPDFPEPFLQACRQLIRNSYPTLKMIVSAGNAGAYGITDRICNFCPAPEVAVLSTAGAGDALLGGVLAAMAAGIPFVHPNCSSDTGQPIQTALQLAVLLASYKCQSPHTISPTADADALVKFARDAGFVFAPEVDSLFVEAKPNQVLMEGV